MRFQIGKSYKHGSGKYMRIIGAVQSTIFGLALVAETPGEGNFRPIGWNDHRYADNWQPISDEEWAAKALAPDSRQRWLDDLKAET